MPPLDEEFEEVKSSDTSVLDEQPTQQVEAPEAKVDAAASSPATGEEDDSLLSVVRDAVDKSKADPSTVSPAKAEEDGDDKPKKPDNEEYSDVPFNKHPRFQQLLRERKDLKVDAERYRNVQGFLDNAGLSAEEASNGLNIMALAKSNPAEAWKQLKPWVQSVLIAAGEVLPEDLQARVQSGEFTAEAALEISRHRATAQSMQTMQSFREQQAQRQQITSLQTAIQTTAMEWEQDRRLKDPNFDAKFVPLQKEIAYLHATEGKPTTPEGVSDQLRRAYKTVNDTFAPRPATPPVRPKAITPVRGGQVAGNQKTGDMSMLDIVRSHRSR